MKRLSGFLDSLRGRRASSIGRIFSPTFELRQPKRIRLFHTAFI